MTEKNDSDRYVVPYNERGRENVVKRGHERASDVIDSDTVRGPKHFESKVRDRK